MPTFEDIAKIAGVSKATVSLALSDSPKISLETKVKIRNIAKSIGYNLNAVEGGKWLRSRSIGILYLSENPDFEKEFFRDTLMGITEDSAHRGYDVVFIGIHTRQSENLAEDITEKVLRSGVEGIVVVSSIPNLSGLDKLIDMRFPMVCVGDRRVDGSVHQLFNVSSDNYNGGRMAAEYLLGLGHTRICLVTGQHPPHWEIDRSNGFFLQLRNAGLTDVEKNAVSINSPFRREDECWTRLHELNPTAVFAVNAFVGISVLHYLRSAEKRIPDDVSVIVFDDFSSFPYENPPITVIKQDKEALGSLAVKVLIDLLENAKVPPRQLLISTQLIERSSCSSPRIK